MRLVLISDTHLPHRGRDLPGPVWAAVEAADAVIALRERLPQFAEATLGGVRFSVVHETGASAGRESRMAARHPQTDVLVFGHSHIPWDTTAGSGLRLLNPGSPTDRRRQPFCTYMTLEADGGMVGQVELHRIGAT